MISFFLENKKMSVKGNLRLAMKNFKQLTHKIIAILSLITLSSSCFAAQTTAGNTAEWEYTQKAKVIKYLLTNVIWPKENTKDDTLHVCVVGSLADSKPIDALNGVMINKLKVKVAKSSLKQAMNNCQLVYIALTEKENDKEIIKQFSGKPVLLISDIPNFADNGGSMNFIETKGLIAITVNVESIKKSNLAFDMAAFGRITVIPKPSDLDQEEKKSKESSNNAH